MKLGKFFITLTLFSITAIFADCENNACECNPCNCDPCECTTNNNSCNTCNTCDCSPCCCEPCDFVPPCPPEVCAYNAPVQIDIKCGWDIFVTGSFIYYYACQENLTFVTSTSLQETNQDGNDVLVLNTSYSDVCFEYKPGFKVGLGFNFGCDDWVFYSEYMRYHATVGKGSFSATAPDGQPGEDSLNVSYLWNIAEENEGMFRDDFFNSEKLSATSSLQLNLDIVDFTLSRNFYVGKCLTFNPHIGLRAAWIDQEYQINGSVIETDGGVRYEGEATNSVDSWAIGGLFGFSTDWRFCGGFFLFGKTDLGLLYTDYDISSTNNGKRVVPAIDAIESNLNSFKRSVDCVRTHLNVGLGLGWADYFCCNDWYFDLRIGYDFYSLLNQSMILPVFGDDDQDDDTVYLRLPSTSWNDIYLHGLVITARLDF